MSDKLRKEVGHSARDGVQLVQAIEEFRVEIGNVMQGFVRLMGSLEDRVKRLEVQFISLHERFKEEIGGKESNEEDSEESKETGEKGTH